MQTLSKKEAIAEIELLFARIEAGEDLGFYSEHAEELRYLLQLRKEWNRPEVIKDARLLSEIEAIKTLRPLGWLQHSPLRSIEKRWLGRVFCGRPSVSLTLVDFAIIYSGFEEMGSHEGDPCHCPDSYRKRKKKA
jgi:hypothetical protein